MSFETPQKPDNEIKTVKEMSVANMAEVAGAGNRSGNEAGSLENDPIILEKKADQLKEQLQEAVAKARETNTDEDVEKAQQLLKQYREVIYKLKPESRPMPKSISANYEYKGTTETIEINLESNLERYNSFYKDHQIKTSENFESEIRRIWAENADKIKQAIEQGGFDDVLFIPPYNTVDINQKTTEQGDYVKNGKPTKTYEYGGETISSIIDTKPNQPRIVLIHRKNAENLKRPELFETKDKSIYELCNATISEEKAKIKELIKNKQPLPIDGLTLGEYLIADRIHFKETGKHLDVGIWAWTPTSYSGASVVHSSWSSNNSQIQVSADIPRISVSFLGCRLARTFM